MRILANLRLWFVFYVCLIPISLHAGAGLSFEPNLGQTAAEIRYLVRTSSGVIFVTDRAVTLNEGASYELLDANRSAEWTPERATGETISYFIGRDPAKWIHDAPRYARLVRHNAYPGIDLILYGAGEELEYDFVLAPNADPARIRLKMAGARSVSIAADGALVVDTPAGELRHRKPVLWETLPDGSRRTIAGAFRILESNVVGFSVNGHDPALALSIDPVLESSTYFGGSGDDQVVATDGNGILVGTTTSVDLPGAQFVRRKGTDIFVKLAQQIMVFGGSGNETVTSAAFGPPTGTFLLAVAGYTNSPDLPNLNALYGGSPPLQANYAGGATDGFLVMVNRTNFLPTLTYIGGPGDDRINAISFDPYTATLAIAGETTEGGLPSPEFPINQFRASPAGGLDGFLMITSSNPIQPLILYSTSYLGGTGDDTILGAAFVNGVCYVTGETKSPDFPLKNALYSKRAGDSDAFIAQIASDGTLAASTLFGGSGSDRGVALGALPGGNVFVAGITSSTDMPLRSPIQKTYGGGSSDAFMAQFDPDLSTLISSTYIGGSDADEATSIAVAPPNTAFVGGWTASQNFPTVNALQSTYGGGPDDGFLVHFDDDGSIYESTFFGGSASDRILGLTVGTYSGPTVWLTGETASPNLPLENANQTSLRGSSDGFVAEITANLFTVGPFHGGKDLRSPLQIYYGNQALASTTTFTIATSDPSKVQVADRYSPGQTSFAFGPNETPYVDCLTDSGGAELTITAPGYPSRTVEATCFPEAIVVVPPNGGNSQFQTNVGATPLSFGFYQVANDSKSVPPNTGAFTRPGANPVTVQIANSNPSVGTVSTPAVSLPLSGQNPTFTPIAIGQTDLAFSAGDTAFLPFNKVHATVNASFVPPQPFSVPTGFQAAVWIAQIVPPQAILTIASKDPSRVALSQDQTKPGKASITFLNPNLSAQPFFVQALGSSGDVDLILSVTGQPNQTTTVHITTPVALLTDGYYSTGQPLQIPSGAIASVAFTIYPADLSHLWTYTLIPGKPPISFSLQSSNAGVVKIDPSTTQVTSSNSGGNFQVIGSTPGSTVLTLTNSANIPTGGPFPSIQAVVEKPSVAFPDIELGRDLTAPMAIRLPVPATSAVVITVSVSDSKLALLSPDTSSPGQSQITTIIPVGQTFARFYVQALAASGTAKVTAAFTGYAVSTATANVTLDPAGFYWSMDSLSATLGQQVSSVRVLSGTLDPATLLPLDSQSLRPGATVVPGFINSNSSVATIDPKTDQITLKSPGNTTLTLQQPPGFTTPAVLQKLAVSVAAPALNLNSFNLGKNTQVALNFAQIALKVTSSDPTKVLVSTDPGKLGSGSVAATATQQVYIQALSDSGSANLKVSSPGYPDASATVYLTPIGLGLSLDYNSGANYQNGKYIATTQSQVTVTVVLYTGNTQVPYGVSFLPGLPLISANIASSNPGVGVITGSPITFDPKHMTYGQPLATATLLPVAPGETSIAISQPSGFSPVGNSALTVDVVLPSLTMGNIVVAKDTLNSVSLPSGPKPGTAVTLTSSDPARILLSPDASTPPSASITTAFQSTSQGAGFFVHALSDNGTVTIKMTAPGFADGSFAAQLAPLAFEFTSVGAEPTRAVIQSGPVQTSVVAAVLSTAYGAYTPLMLRPGVPAIVVGVSSSDPSIVSVSPKQLVFKGNTLQGSVKYTPLKPGTATLRLAVPSGYVFSPSQSQLAILADEAKIFVSDSSIQQVGRDLQQGINFTLEVLAPNLPVKVTSSNPSLLVVASDAVTPGQGSVTQATPNAYGVVYAQALAGSGNVSLFFTAPGYQTATLPITLSPVGAIFQSLPQLNILSNAGVQQINVALTPLDPVTLQPGMSTQSPRPGASFSVPVTSSDTKVMAVTTPTVQISAQQISPQPAAGLQPVSAGTAIVTLGALAGNPEPASGNQVVFTVSDAELSLPALALGIDLEAPVQINLASSVATPKVDTPITVSVNNYHIVLAATSRDPGKTTLPVIIPAGQRSSKPFYVQGLAIGSDSLSYGGGPYQNYSTPVTVTQTAFVIQEAAGGEGLNLNKGASAKITIVPALSPPSDAGPTLSIRGGANPITIAVASTEPSVATTSPPVLTFNPGDQKATVSVQGLSAGTATVKVLGTMYDFGQPQAAIQVTVK